MNSPKVHQQPTLAVDFDGVIHAYGRGWHGGVIYDEPVEGTEDALRRLRARYKLVVFTARHDLDAVHLWLVTHGLRPYFTDITNRKPAAKYYLDDRAVKFDSWSRALDDLL